MLKWTKHGQIKDAGKEFHDNLNSEVRDVFISKHSDCKVGKDAEENRPHSFVPSTHHKDWDGDAVLPRRIDHTSPIPTDPPRSSGSLESQSEQFELSQSDYGTVRCSVTSCFFVKTAPPIKPNIPPLNRSAPVSAKPQITRHTHFKPISLEKLFKAQESEKSGDRRGKKDNSTASKQIHPLSAVRTMASELPDITNLVKLNRDVLGPEVTWDEQDLSLTQLVEKDCFPCVCCYEESVTEKDGQWDKLQPGLKIYSRQPVLMHAGVRQIQARARTIFKDPSGTFYEVGQTMIIPGDYQGWFELVPSDFARASCFLSISEVAKAMPKKFFTRSNIRAIRTEGEGESQKFLERKIPAGSVLEIKGTFTAKWKTVAETGLLKRKKKEWEFQEVTYLKCLDADHSEILVPLTHRGKFNAIYEKGQLTQNSVYSIKDILSDMSLPVKVRLLFGKAPVVPCIFTGMLIIRSASVMDSVVGCTILNKRNVLFEIPVSSPVKVKFLMNDIPFTEMSTYKDAQKLCKKFAKVFSSMIKLAPDMDTGQKVILHVPTDPSLMKQIDESLRALDLITDISLTSEPEDHLLDTGSLDSGDQVVLPPPGALIEQTEYKSRESQTFV